MSPSDIRQDERRSGGRSAERRTRRSRRHEFLNAALRRFARHGYHATSTRDICAELGVAPSAMYNYFRNKQDILFEIIVAEMTAMQQGLDALLARSAGVPVDERLEASVSYIFLRAIETQDAWRLVISELRELKPEYRQEVVARRDYFEGRIRALISEGMESGLWPRGDVRLTSFSLFGMAEGLCRWYRPGGGDTAQQIIAFNTDFFMRALKAVPTIETTTGPD